MATNFYKVLTSAGTFRCRRVVISAGAWINKVLQPLGVTVPVNVTQENVTYFATPNIKKFTKDKCVFVVIKYIYIYTIQGT